MNDPQAWTLIGVFAAMVLGGMTLMTTQMSRVIRAESVAIRGEVRGEISELRGELRGEIVGIGARLEVLERKVDALDKEVANLATKFWGSH